MQAHHFSSFANELSIRRGFVHETQCKRFVRHQKVAERNSNGVFVRNTTTVRLLSGSIRPTQLESIEGIKKSLAVRLKINYTMTLAALMPRSHIHGLDAGLATDAIRHHSWNPHWSVAFRIASVIIRSST